MTSANWDRVATIMLCVWTLAVGWTSLAEHPTPLYSVESDTIGEYIPAARELRRGILEPGHYQTKAFGYPLILAATGWLAGGDDYLSARAVNVTSAAVGGGVTYLLFKAFLGAEAGGFVLAGLLLNPIYARLAIEAGSDVPTFALLIAATLLLVSRRRSRDLFASGLLAGYAVITRYNSLFLVPAALLVLARRRPPPVAWVAYAAGLALPLGGWWIAAHGLKVGWLGAGNVFNVAYEIYGRAMTPENFGAAAGRQFHTYWDVVHFQPAVFAARIATNLSTRWLEDLRVLLPVWLGAFALPGILVGWWRRPGWPAMAAHFALCYASLTAIFYLARFGLYLIPFYLSGVVTLILEARSPARPRTRAASSRGWGHALRPALLTLLIVASGLRAVADIRLGLAIAPHETRVGGLILKGLGHPGDRVMARKPNVAFLAGLDYVPLPDQDVLDFPGLMRYASETHTRFLFFSVAEKVTRPQFGLLGYPGVSLPGLRQIAFRGLDPQRYCALYEFGTTPVDVSTLEDSVVAALRGIAAEQPRLAWARAQLGLHLSNLGRYREALAELDVAQQLDPGNEVTARLQIQAYEHLGEYENEAAACERAIRIGSRSGMERAALGRVWIRQRRWGEAVASLSDALDIDPGNVDYRYSRAVAMFGGGDTARAQDDLGRVLQLQPGHARARLLAARLLRLQGRTADALAMLASARTTDSLEARELRALVDSLRAGRRASVRTAPGSARPRSSPSEGP